MSAALVLLLLCSFGCSKTEGLTMPIKVSLEVLKVVRVMEDIKQVDFDCELTLKWNPWITGNATGYDLSHPENVWEPDVMSLNSEITVFHHPNTDVDAQFNIIWKRKLRTRVSYETTGPDQEARCEITFTSKAHDISSLRLQPSDDFIHVPDGADENGYRLKSEGAVISSRTDPCCDRHIDVIAFPLLISK